MLSTHNLPCLLVELLEHSPWSRREGGKASPTCQDLTGCFQKILRVNGSDSRTALKTPGCLTQNGARFLTLRQTSLVAWVF